VPNISVNMLSISKLTNTCKIVDFFPYRLYVRDLKKGKSIVSSGILDPTDSLNKFFEMNQLDTELTALVSCNDERS